MIKNLQLNIVPLISFQSTGLYVFATIYGLIMKIQWFHSVQRFQKRVDALEQAAQSLARCVGLCSLWFIPLKMIRFKGMSTPVTPQSLCCARTTAGSFCGQAYLAHVRFSPHASSFQGPQPTTTTSASRGSLMVASSQPPATMWQGPSDNFSAMQSTNDRRMSHAALHHGQRNVTSGPFGHSLATTRRSRASTSRRSVSSSGPLPDPLLSTFRLNLIPYSVRFLVLTLCQDTHLSVGDRDLIRRG